MILADQCVQEACVRAVELAGIEITRLKTVASPELPDDDVLALAAQRDELLLTEDKDFTSILRYPPGLHAGIIVLRGTASHEAAVLANLLSLLRTHSREEMRGKLIIVDATKVRIRSQVQSESDSE